jgi:replicative DNA helicase
MDTRRSLPHSLRAEESVLGAMLLSRDAIAAVADILQADHFYKPAHGHICKAIFHLYSTGEPVDAVTVSDELKRAGLLDEIGGQSVLLDLQASTPAICNAYHYAKIVEEHALLRRLVVVGNEITEMAYSIPDDVEQAIDDAEAKVFDVARRRVTTTTASMAELLPLNMDAIEAAFGQPGATRGTRTGYLDIDERLGGLQPGSLYVVGARPAMGKTAWSLGAACNSAMKDRKPVLIFTLEMSQLELSQRLLCSEALVDSGRVKSGNLDDAEWSRLSHAVGRLAEAPIFIDDNPRTSIMDIRAKARRLKSREGDLGMIVIDYIQLMSGRSNAESRQVEVSEISRNLKILARELETPVVALAQLNRSLEQRTDKRPMLSDLRESGSLEQDADVVLFLYRDEVYDDSSPDKGVAEVIVAKHRNGAVGRERLAFRGQFTRFDNMARAVPPTHWQERASRVFAAAGSDGGMRYDGDDF